MSQHDRSRAMVPPVPADVVRPLWSVMIPTWNCAGYLRETLAGVLAQDPGPHAMQIEVVDDHSTRDDPEAVVAELGSGRVAFHRQPQNLGHTGNFATCLARARGHLVHLLHGDDLVQPGFYRAIQAAFEHRPEIGAAFCRQRYIDERGATLGTSDLEQPESGILVDWLAKIAVNQRIQTPSIVVRRDVYEKLGAFDRRLSWVEDWEMWARIAAAYPVWYEAEPLARYRIHAASSTGRHMRTGENLRDVRRAVAIIRTYLRADLAAATSRRSLEHWALDTLRYRVPDMLGRGDLTAAAAQIREALRCSRSATVCRLVPALIGRLASLWLRRALQRSR